MKSFIAYSILATTLVLADVNINLDNALDVEKLKSFVFLNEGEKLVIKAIENPTTGYVWIASGNNLNK
jgi:predicted secreted protein